jgi:hypothetical protein
MLTSWLGTTGHGRREQHPTRTSTPNTSYLKVPLPAPWGFPAAANAQEPEQVDFGKHRGGHETEGEHHPAWARRFVPIYRVLVPVVFNLARSGK